MSYYCHNCGNKIETKSNFCGKCGCSLASLSSKPEPPPKIKQKTRIVAEDDDGDDEESDNLEHFETSLDKLDIEITGYSTKDTKETIAGVVALGKAEPYGTRDAPDKDLALKELFAEAKAQREE